MRSPHAFVAGLSAIVLVCGSGCSSARFYHKSDALSASVVDAETGDPVPGAVVVAIWQLERPRFFHGTDYWALKRVETTTGPSGRFTLEPWSRWIIWPFWGTDNYSRHVYFFKPGYKFEIIGDSDLNSFANIPWNSSQIRLRPPDESPKNYAIRLSSIRSELCDPYRNEGAECGNALIEYFAAEKQRLFAVGVKRAYW